MAREYQGIGESPVRYVLPGVDRLAIEDGGPTTQSGPTTTGMISLSARYSRIGDVRVGMSGRRSRKDSVSALNSHVLLVRLSDWPDLKFYIRTARTLVVSGCNSAAPTFCAVF